MPGGLAERQRQRLHGMSSTASGVGGIGPPRRVSMRFESSDSAHSSGAVLALVRSIGLFVFDHRLAPQIREIVLGLRAEFLLEHFVAHFCRPGASFLVSFLAQTANICTPSAVCSGGVKWPTSVLSRMSRSSCGKIRRGFADRIAHRDFRKRAGKGMPSVQSEKRPRSASASRLRASKAASGEPRGTTKSTGRTIYS